MTYYGHELVVLAARMRKEFRQFLPLVKGKDESKKQKRLVYSIPCTRYEFVHVGYTERKRDKRMQEYKSNINKHISSEFKIS